MIKNTRNIFISIFVIVWLGIFHYESIRHFYLNPLFKKELPKVKFLFPPAGWIMFFQVQDRFATTEVYGIKDEQSYLIDPHDIFRVRTIGFDNIHRGILGVAARKEVAYDFCRYLEWRFEEYDRFTVTQVYYPTVTKKSQHPIRTLIYQCSDT